MTRKRSPQIEALTRQLTDLDEHRINELYGLEPVYEPQGESHAALPTRFFTVQCPYCGELIDTQIDVSAGSCNYIEDCQVCCQPIDMHIAVGDDGELLSVEAQRGDH